MFPSSVWPSCIFLTQALTALFFSNLADYWVNLLECIFLTDVQNRFSIISLQTEASLLQAKHLYISYLCISLYL